jgi:CspA family cold shock protein
MPYQDTWVTCTKCGKQFVFKIEEQRRQAQRGEEVTSPELCPSCRAPSRAERRPEPWRESRPSAAAGQTSQKPGAVKALGPGPHEGHVKWYDREKGYGFIVHPGGEELFFHRTGIAPGEILDFPDGTKVTYCVEQTEKGPQAVDVERMDA